MKCNVFSCQRTAIKDSNRCEEHRLRWIVAAPVEPKVSPWVRKALAGTLPPKAA